MAILDRSIRAKERLYGSAGPFLSPSSCFQLNELQPRRQEKRLVRVHQVSDHMGEHQSDLVQNLRPLRLIHMKAFISIVTHAHTHMRTRALLPLEHQSQGA